MLAAILLAACAQTLAPAQWIERELNGLVALYEQLHAAPELSFHEAKSAARMAQVLKDAGYTVIEPIGGHGLAGVLENGAGPTLLIRCDMDALPIVEETGLSFASKVKVKDETGVEVGVMHACGHDVHMTVWSGVARLLAERRADWSGRLILLAQPAEERGSGARAMLADRLYERVGKPDFCLALHVKAELPAGVIGSTPGYALANVDSVDILVRGRGGHGSTPEVTHDPVVLAARIVVGLQSIVSREISAQEAAVITVGSIHGGTKHNIIPNEVKLQLTVRSYEPAVRRHLLAAIERTALNEARAAGFPEELLPRVEVLPESIGATYNDPALVARANAAILRALGPGSVRTTPPVMGGEDFGLFGPAAAAPGYLFWLGVTDPAQWQAAQEGGPAVPAVHTSRFTPQSRASIRTGVLAMTAAALELLAPH